MLLDQSSQYNNLTTNMFDNCPNIYDETWETLTTDPAPAPQQTEQQSRLQARQLRQSPALTLDTRSRLSEVCSSPCCSLVAVLGNLQIQILIYIIQNSEQKLPFYATPTQRNTISSGLFCEVFTVYKVCEKVWGRKFLTY